MPIEEKSTRDRNPKSDKVTKVKDIFGLLKGKLNKSTEEIMREVDEDLWPEEE